MDRVCADRRLKKLVSWDRETRWWELKKDVGSRSPWIEKNRAEEKQPMERGWWKLGKEQSLQDWYAWGGGVVCDPGPCLSDTDFREGWGEWRGKCGRAPSPTSVIPQSLPQHLRFCIIFFDLFFFPTNLQTCNPQTSPYHCKPSKFTGFCYRWAFFLPYSSGFTQGSLFLNVHLFFNLKLIFKANHCILQDTEDRAEGEIG